MLIGRSGFSRILSKRSFPSGSSKSDIVIKIYETNSPSGSLYVTTIKEKRSP